MSLAARSCAWVLPLVLAGGCSPADPDRDQEPPVATAARLFDPALAGPGKQVFEQKCSLCHKLAIRDGKALGPSVEESFAQLPARLAPEAYARTLENLQISHPAHHAAGVERFAALLAETDPDRRLARWLLTYTADPRFDNPASRMAPVPGLAARDIEAVVAYMMSLR